MTAAVKLSRELRRILSERFTWLIVVLTAASAVWFSLNGTGRTASDAFIINAAKNAAFFGAFLFTLLTLSQMHRDYKNNTDVIVQTYTDPIRHQLHRTLALISVAIVTMLVVLIFALPYGIIKTGSYFQLATFFTAWFLIFLCALIFTALLTSGLYMLTKRVEAAFIFMAGLILLSKMLETMYTLNPSYLFYWVQTTASSFSDLITNQFQIIMLLWNRLFWLLLSLGIWALGLCSLRRYGRGLFGSLLTNCRRLLVPVLLIAALSLSTASYIYEPVFDDSKPIDFSGMINSSGSTGMVTSYYSGIPAVGNTDLILEDKSFNLDVDTGRQMLSGISTYQLDNISGNAQTLPVLINTGLSIDSVVVNGIRAEAIRGETGESSSASWSVKLPAADKYDIEIAYSGHIRNDNSMIQKATYGIADGFVWLPPLGVSPKLDIQVAEESAFSGVISLDGSLEPVFMKGKSEKEQSGEGKTKWVYSGAAGSQSVSFFTAEYQTKTFEAGGLDIDFKYFKKHDKSVTEMDAVGVIKAAIDYFTQVYGPLIYSQELTMLELPAYVSGGFAGGNMSAMDETNFAAEGYLPVESLSPDQGGGIDVLIHEIAHQWWGLGSMPMPDGVSNWSAEGLTCYSTYCFMTQYFGEDYANEHYLKVWQQGYTTYKNAFYIQHPEYLAKLSAADVSNIMSAYVSMKQYDIMSLMLVKGAEALGGTEVFQNKLSELYMTHIMQPITYQDFLTATGLTEEEIDLA